ncbi:pyocin knob domain-containing protein [Pseudomonas petrae]|uniref:Pyocin knob domain-containing protein n=1 Tax=Pseudomonas petrae TaxID=2912190 RepID=A0ABS9I804_9PSED|nr:pyocin knob domain-containing protein [Pseudomonas petrae]MCF7543894.1 pyocin knob domain-containing protein [Pseudomonas petrae]
MNGKTGVVSLVKSDVGLGGVDNVSVIAAGIGKSGVVADTANIDSTLLTNGWYPFGPATQGTKPSGQDRGVVLVSGRAFQADARCTQLWFTEESTRVFVRKNSQGTWTTWTELTRPALASANKRKPLVVSDDGLTEAWSSILSVPMYLDRSITGSAVAAQALDVSSYSVFDYGLTVNTTLSFANLPSLAGETLTVVIRIRQNASPKTITWPSNITWLTPGGLTPPTPGTNQIVEYVLSTIGSPANWYGRVGAST